MEHWNKRVEASWEKFERVFDIQNLKTPSVKHGAPKTPQAPKKVNKFQICREGLKPRKLTYEQENVKKVEERPNKVWQDSGIALWATSSAALRMEEEIDKENRPESDDVVTNSQMDKSEQGSLRNKLNQWMAKIHNTVRFK